jgi:trk system potassium uptake protein
MSSASAGSARRWRGRSSTWATRCSASTTTTSASPSTRTSHPRRAGRHDQRATLRQIGVADVHTAVVCIGDDVEASVLTTVALVDLGVPNVWAKAITEQHATILERVGAITSCDPRPRWATGSRTCSAVGARVPRPRRRLRDRRDGASRRVSPVSRSASSGSAPSTGHGRVHQAGRRVFTYAERDTVLGADDLIVIAGHRHDVERFV